MAMRERGAVLLGNYLVVSGTDFKPCHTAFLKMTLDVVGGSIDYSALVGWVASVAH